MLRVDDKSARFWDNDEDHVCHRNRAEQNVVAQHHFKTLMNWPNAGAILNFAVSGNDLFFVNFLKVELAGDRPWNPQKNRAGIRQRLSLRRTQLRLARVFQS